MNTKSYVNNFVRFRKCTVRFCIHKHMMRLWHEGVIANLLPCQIPPHNEFTISCNRSSWKAEKASSCLFVCLTEILHALFSNVYWYVSRLLEQYQSSAYHLERNTQFLNNIYDGCVNAWIIGCSVIHFELLKQLIFTCLRPDSQCD